MKLSLKIRSDLKQVPLTRTRYQRVEMFFALLQSHGSCPQHSKTLHWMSSHLLKQRKGLELYWHPGDVGERLFLQTHRRRSMLGVRARALKPRRHAWSDIRKYFINVRLTSVCHGKQQQADYNRATQIEKESIDVYPPSPTPAA